MEKKKLSAKQIFRTLAFQYHLNEKVPLDLLAEMSATLYYPLDPDGFTKARYKSSLLAFMKQYNNHQKAFREEEFCKFMTDMQKNGNPEYTAKVAQRIFNRYANKEGVIDGVGFAKMAEAFKLEPSTVQSFFKSNADRKNQISFEKFLEYMNCLKDSKAS